MSFGRCILLTVTGLFVLVALSGAVHAAPAMAQQAKLVASDGALGDNFGASVAVSGDTAIVGSNLDDDKGDASGSVYVYVRSGSSWAQQAKIVPADGAAGDQFGYSVALDGDTAVIGATFRDSSGTDSGAVYVFTRVGSAWTQQATLLPADLGTLDRYGWSVSVSGDTAIVGSPLDDDKGANSGSAYVWTRSGTSWSQQAKIVPADGSSADEFGTSVSMDGDTTLIGAIRDDPGTTTDGGSVYVFTRSGGVWTQQAKLIASDAATGDHFGSSVAVNQSVAVVGAVLAQSNGVDSGAAYTFARSGTTWTQQARLFPSELIAGDKFGTSVATNGTSVVVGAEFADPIATSSGAAYLYTANGASWPQTLKLVPDDGQFVANFGHAVSLSGNTTLIGAYRDNAPNSDSGSAYAFAPDFTPPTLTWSFSPSVNANGWWRGSVTVAFSCNDVGSGSISVPSQTVSTEGANQSVTASCTDASSNTASATVSGINIDLTSANITHEHACSVAFSFGWCSSGLSTSTNFTDALSGIDNATKQCQIDGIDIPCGSSNNVTGDGTHQQYGFVRDLASNGNQASVNVKLDGTPPTLTATRTAPNANGWNNGNVTVNYTCTDATSGPRVIPANVTVSTEGANQTVARSCTDFANNTASITFNNISIDTTPPTLTVTRTAPNANGWNNGGVTVTYACTDAMSGVKTAPQNVIVSTEGANQTVSGTCTDNAGNSATVTLTNISIDRSMPIVTATTSSSPLASCAPPGGALIADTFDTENSSTAQNNYVGFANWTVTRGGTDLGGSSLAAGSHGLVLDLDGSSNRGGVRLESHSVTLQPGCYLLQFRLGQNGAGFSQNFMNVTLGGLYGEMFTHTVADASYSNVGRRIDVASTTTTKLVFDHDGNDNRGLVLDEVFLTPLPGWSTSAITTTFTCTDAVSGVLTFNASAVTLGDGADQAVARTCTDFAGNLGGYTVANVSIDQTAPVLTATRTAPNANGWNNGTVSVGYVCTDATSGVATAPANTSISTEGANQTLSDTCKDVAGNSNTSTLTNVSIDLTAPTISNTQSPVANANGWSHANVTVSWSCSDALSGLVGLPSNITLTEGANQSASATCTDLAGNNATSTRSNISIDTTAPTLSSHTDATAEATSASGATVSYTAPTATDALSGAGDVTCSPASGATFALGDTTVTCSATDVAGNTGSSTFTVSVADTTAPSVTVPSDITKEATGATGATASFTATASDTVDGAITPTCSPASGSTFALGNTTVTCSATDAAGNEGSSTFTVRVRDTTAPTVTVPDDITKEATSGSGATATFAASASDLVDGAITPTCSPASGSTFALGNTTVTCNATDGAGNKASSTFNVRVQDTTAPSVTVPSDITKEASGASGATASFTATASDLVDGAITPTCSPASGSTFALGDTTVTCSATDAAGNEASSTFRVTVGDSTAPTVTVPDDMTLEATSASGATATFIASASDTVDGAIDPTCSPASGSTFALGDTTVTCSATDAAGNTGSSTFTVSVEDTTAPTLTVPDDITAEAESASGAMASFAASASDLVDGDVSTTCAPESGSTFALGSTTVTCTATDAAGNTASSSFDVTVVDTTAPSVTVPSDITTEATDGSGAIVSFAATASDTVDGAISTTCAPSSGSTFALGDTTVTCSATDAAGNTGSSTFTVSVGDSTAPRVTVPDDITAEAASASGAAVGFAATATDGVDGAIAATCAPQSDSTFALGTTTVTCSATDAAGNTGSASFTVTVVDTTAPAIEPATDLTMEATGPDGAVVAYAAPVTHDAVDGDGAADCAPASGTTFALGSTIVACSARDAAGNAASSSFAVRVVDSTPPALTTPGSLGGEATGPDGATLAFEASASDLVDGPVSITCAPASGSLFPLGTTLVTCSASDAAGNAADASFGVTIGDRTAPAISFAQQFRYEATSPEGGVVTYDASASDIVDGPIVPTCSPASGTVFPLGATDVTCTATDAAGNRAVAAYEVVVWDSTAPTMNAPRDVLAQATGADGAAVAFDAPATHDAVDGDGVATCAPASGSTFAAGHTTVTCDAVDAAGNHAASRTFDVYVTRLTRIELTGPATAVAGSTVTFGLAGFDEQGASYPLAQATLAWTAPSDVGPAEASYEELGVRGSASVDVTAAGLARIDVAGPDSLVAGTHATFDLSGFDQFGNAVPLDATQLDYAAPTTAGPATVSYTERGVTGTKDVTIAPATLARIEIHGPATLVVGTVGSFDLLGFDVYENAAPLAQATMDVDAGTLATTRTITYAEQGVTGSTSVEILHGARVRSAVALHAGAVNVREALPLQLLGFDAFDNAFTVDASSWHATLGTITPTGVFRGSAAGTARIDYALDDDAGSTTVLVLRTFPTTVTLSGHEFEWSIGAAPIITGAVHATYVDGGALVGGHARITFTRTDAPLDVGPWNQTIACDLDPSGDCAFIAPPEFTLPGTYRVWVGALDNVNNYGVTETSYVVHVDGAPLPIPSVTGPHAPAPPEAKARRALESAVA